MDGNFTFCRLSLGPVLRMRKSGHTCNPQIYIYIYICIYIYMWKDMDATELRTIFRRWCQTYESYFAPYTIACWFGLSPFPFPLSINTVASFAMDDAGMRFGMRLEYCPLVSRTSIYILPSDLTSSPTTYKVFMGLDSADALWWARNFPGQSTARWEDFLNLFLRVSLQDMRPTLQFH